MPKPSLMPCLMIVSAAVAVASCETPGLSFPPAADLTVEPAPVPTVEILTSRVAGEKYDNARDAWGERGWAQVSRLCRFFDHMGMPDLDCPEPEPPRRPDPG